LVGIHVKSPYFLSELNETRIFPTDLSKKQNSQISNFMTTLAVGDEMLFADGRIDREADMPNLMVAFCNFANASRNWRDALFCF